MVGGPVFYGVEKIMGILNSLNLDVAAPQDVAVVLERAANAFVDSANDLRHAWQEDGAGVEWIQIANSLRATAMRIERMLAARSVRYWRSEGFIPLDTSPDDKHEWLIVE
jgi:hypothetical protein